MPIMLAEDFDEGKLVFPLIAQPKVDGVRALNEHGTLTGRSRKTHKNIYTTNFYSHPCLIGFDGEMAAQHECHPALCRITSSALSTIHGEPFTLWWLFDYMSPPVVNLPYTERLKKLQEQVDHIGIHHPDLWNHLRVMPTIICYDKEELDEFEDKCLSEGYEGVCVRKIEGKHKDGRSTVREGGLLRIKRFIEAEALVTGIVEGQENGNDAQTNENGKTFRSSHQENMTPNGMIGSLTCVILKDVKDPRTKQILLTKDQIITVSPGKMNHNDRRWLFQNPHLILQQIIKFKFFPKGLKDKPRFPTFESIRSKEDM